MAVSKGHSTLMIKAYGLLRADTKSDTKTPI